MATDSNGKGSVGHGRPPQHSRFKEGKSGNPRGRPKGARNLKTDVMEEMREWIVVREGEHPRRISKQRAIIKSLVNRTLKGDSRAANTLMNLLFRILDPEGESPTPSPALTAEEQDVLEAFKARLLESDDTGDTTAADPDTKESES
jgi:hypothetical protein